MNTTNSSKKVTSIRLNQELYNRIQIKAKKENRSINNFIEKALSEYTKDKIEMTQYEFKNMIEEAQASKSYKLSEEQEKNLFSELL